MNWPIEIIPDKDFLYRRVHNNLRLISRNFDEIPPYVFKDNNRISTEWNQYSAPEETRQRALNPQYDITNIIIKITIIH